jgi:oxygen-dependent protoporphyrinogen oxidase
MRVGIVGAGITGLALTHHLAERGVESVAFEASDEAGGVIQSREIDGVVVEHGPQRARMTDGVAELVDTAGLRGEAVFGDDDLPLYVYVDGKLRRAPLSLGAFLRTDLLSWRAKLRLLREPLTDPIRPEESAEEAFVRKFGREAYDNLVGPLYGGTYGSDPAEMPAEHALSGIMRIEKKQGSLLKPAAKRLLPGGDSTPPPVTFEDGMQRLPAALTEFYADRVELGTPVTAIHNREDGFVLATVDGEHEVDEVVVTAPAAAAAELLEPLAPETAPGLADLTYNSLAYVFLQADCDVAGLGYQVRRDEALRTLGVTWNCAAFDRDDLFTCFMGGMHDPAILEEAPAEIGQIAAEEFERVMDTEADVLGVNVLEDGIPAYDGSWDAVEALELPEGVHLATNYTARLGVPARIREAKRLAGQFASKAGDDDGAARGERSVPAR